MPAFEPSMLKSIADKTEGETDGEALRFKSGNVYEGALADGTAMDGAGSYIWAAHGVSYKGDFKANTIVGAGAYEWSDGSTYEGQVVAGLRHGTGKFTGKGGSPVYEGEWKEGRRHGHGKLVYTPGGNVYEGQWADDMREGQGTLTHASGNVYKGAWKADMKNGSGSFFW
jgi:hypothetical protein